MAVTETKNAPALLTSLDSTENPIVGPGVAVSIVEADELVS